MIKWPFAVISKVGISMQLGQQALSLNTPLQAKGIQNLNFIGSNS